MWKLFGVALVEEYSVINFPFVLRLVGDLSHADVSCRLIRASETAQRRRQDLALDCSGQVSLQCGGGAAQDCQVLSCVGFTCLATIAYVECRVTSPGIVC